MPAQWACACRLQSSRDARTLRQHVAHLKGLTVVDWGLLAPSVKPRAVLGSHALYRAEAPCVSVIAMQECLKAEVAHVGSLKNKKMVLLRD